MNLKTLTFEELVKTSSKRLEEIFVQSETPDVTDLANFEFQGYNLPVFTKFLGIQKFIKGFFQLEPNAEGNFEGYNTPAKQNGFQNEWIPMPDPQNPKRFGFFDVKKVISTDVENKYPNAVILNYGTTKRKNPLGPEQVLRDYVVKIPNDTNNLFLGKAYIALGNFRIYSNFFVLNKLWKTKIPVVK